MPKSKRLRNGIGAVVSVYKRFLHPRVLVCAKYPNAAKADVLDGLLVVGQEEKIVCKRPQTCVIMRHDDFDDGELIHVVARYCKVQQEGASEHFFNEPQRDEPEGVGAVAVANEEEDRLEIPLMLNEDASNFRAQGFEVDDDNEPAPENIPNRNNSNTECEYLSWGSESIEPRRAAGVGDVQPNLVGSDGTLHSVLGYFLHFVPMAFIKNVILPATNAKLSEALTWEEFLRFMGIVFIIATTQSLSRREFWSLDPPSMFSGAPFRLDSIMSRRRFESILKHLTFTLSAPPLFKNPFYEVSDMIDAWNNHTQTCFTPSWINCLDESMSVWTNRWTCPGWMFVPRKPHPMGNEYHTLCCGISGIMYAIELVEGKDRPRQLPAPKFSEHGKTPGLLLRLTECIHHSGRVVIMDSGFCVLEGLTKLLDFGVFSSAVIKKRRYWPRHVDGDAVDKHFDNREVGWADVLPGILNGRRFRLFGMKEEDYVMKLMSTYGALKPIDDARTHRSVTDENGQRVNKSFRYTEPYVNHFKYRHQVDDHNNLRHSPISLEMSMNTKDWKIRVFMFLMAIVEVNARLAYAFFNKLDSTPNQLEFRQQLAKELLEFSASLHRRGRSKRKRDSGAVASNCKLETAPAYASRWTGTEWEYLSGKYSQHVCRTYKCQKRIRTYCRCMIGHWMCPTCVGIHIASKEISTHE